MLENCKKRGRSSNGEVSGGRTVKIHRAGSSAQDEFLSVFGPTEPIPPNLENDFSKILEEADHIKTRCVLVKACMEGRQSYLNKKFFESEQFGIKVEKPDHNLEISYDFIVSAVQVDKYNFELSANLPIIKNGQMIYINEVENFEKLVNFVVSKNRFQNFVTGGSDYRIRVCYVVCEYYEVFRNWSMRVGDFSLDFPRKNLKGFFAETIGVRLIDFNKLEVSLAG